jgi:hypothetical protein
MVERGHDIAAKPRIGQLRGDRSGQTHGFQGRMHPQRDPAGHVVVSQPEPVSVLFVQDHSEALFLGDGHDGGHACGDCRIWGRGEHVLTGVKLRAHAAKQR